MDRAAESWWEQSGALSLPVGAPYSRNLGEWGILEHPCYQKRPRNALCSPVPLPAPVGTSIRWTTNPARFCSRWAPFVGWALLAYDAVDYYMGEMMKPDCTRPEFQAQGYSICFPAGTKVHSETGLQDIETVSTGTRVWSFDRKRKEWVLMPVRALEINEFVRPTRDSGRRRYGDTGDEHPSVLGRLGPLAGRQTCALRTATRLPSQSTRMADGFRQRISCLVTSCSRARDR